MMFETSLWVVGMYIGALCPFETDLQPVEKETGLQAMRLRLRMRLYVFTSCQVGTILQPVVCTPAFRTCLKLDSCPG